MSSNLVFSKFEIEIDGESYDNTFEQDVSVDRTDLETEFENYARTYARYAVLHEIAKDMELRLKRELEILYAQLDQQKRIAAREVMSETKIKYTEKMYENEVKTDAIYQELELKYFDAKKTTGLLGAAKTAVDHKRFMLQSMGANARVGHDASELRIKEQRYKQGK